MTQLLAAPNVHDSIVARANSLSTTDVVAIKLDIEEKRERLLDMRADGLLTKVQLKDRLGKLDDELRRAAQSGKRNLTIPKTLPEIEAWWDRATVQMRAELFSCIFEDIEIRPSRRPRGSRGIEPGRLLLHSQDTPTLRKIGPKALTGMIE